MSSELLEVLMTSTFTVITDVAYILIADMGDPGHHLSWHGRESTVNLYRFRVALG